MVNPQGNEIEVSIVIATKAKHLCELDQCLSSIAKQSIRKELIEVIIVGPSPELIEQVAFNPYAERFSLRALCSADTENISSAFNLGLYSASGKILLLMSDEGRLHHTYQLREIVDLHKKHPRAWGIGGYYLNPKNLPIMARALNEVGNAWLWRRHKNQGVGPLLLANFSLKQEALLRDLRFQRALGAEAEAFYDRVGFKGGEFILDSRHSLYYESKTSPIIYLKHAIMYGKALNELQNQKLNRQVLHKKRSTQSPSLVINPIIIGLIWVHRTLVALSFGAHFCLRMIRFQNVNLRRNINRV